MFDGLEKSTGTKTPSAFEDYVDCKLGPRSMARLRDAFEKTGLPWPAARDEFVMGATGPLVFSNVLGLVVRIQPAMNALTDITDSPWVDRPFYRDHVDANMLGIYGGGFAELSEAREFDLKSALKQEERCFFDTGLFNTTRRPVYTPDFPDGIPCVCDPGAVSNLAGRIAPVRTALEKRVLAALDEHYAPLAQAFAGTDGPRLAAAFTRAGKLVAGWNDQDAIQLAGVQASINKTKAASIAAAAYDVKVMRALNGMGNP